MQGGANTGSLGTLVFGGAPHLRTLQEIARSRRVRGELARAHKLEERLKLDREESLRWLDDHTQVEAIGQVGPVSSGVGLRITVTCPGTSRLKRWWHLRGTFTTEEAKRLCADLANELAAALDQYSTQVSVTTARETREFVARRKVEVEKELGATEKRLQELQIRHRFLDPEQKAGALLDQTKTVVTAYAQAQAQIASLEAAVGSGRRKLSKEEVMRVMAEVKEHNPVLLTLEDKLAQMRLELAMARAEGKSPEHPEVLSLQSAIKEAEAQEHSVTGQILSQCTRQANPIHDEILTKMVGNEVMLAGAQAEKKVLAAQLSKALAEESDLPPVVRQYVQLKRRWSLQTELVMTLAKRLELAQIEEERQRSGSFSVLDEAVAPLRKSGPSSSKSALATFILLNVVLGLAWGCRRGWLIIHEEAEGSER